MKRVAICMVCFVVSTSVGTVTAGQDKTEPALRLELNLVDGSRIIGTPSIESVPVQTSYTKINVPLKHVARIVIEPDHEMAVIDMQNGDKLTGTVTLEPIKLDTLIGRVSISAEHIRELRTRPGAGTLQDGLVLYYSFDVDEGRKVTDQSGQGSHGYWVGSQLYESGVKGKAARFTSKDTYIVSTSGRLNMNGWKEATVCIWVRFEEHTTYGVVVSRGSLNSEQAGAFWLQAGQQYGRGILGFLGTPTQSAVEYQSTQANLPLKRWYHLAMAYDGTSLRYYIDGKLEKEVPAKERNTPIWDSPDSKLVIGNASRLPLAEWADMFLNGSVDELYIHNRALSGDEVKQMYDAQNPKFDLRVGFRF